MEYFIDERFKHSRMYNDSDLESFSKYKYFGKYRPRGVLSGLLVIKNNKTPIEFIQPNRPKITIRLRIHESFTEKGPAIFLAYLIKNKSDNSQTLMIEDILLYENKNLFQTMNFDERWKIVNHFFTSTSPKLFTADSILSNNIKVQCAVYYSLFELPKPEDQTDILNPILEMIPNNKNMKKVIILLEKDDDCKVFIAERILGKGPDLFYLKKEGTEEYLEKIAAIQKLSISKELRKLTTVKVKCIFNEKFDKYEIVEIIS
jgi:hypothetical protein